MDDLGAFLFSLAAGTLLGYCFGNFHRTTRYPRPQRAPRTFRK